MLLMKRSFREGLFLEKKIRSQGRNLQTKDTSKEKNTGYAVVKNAKDNLNLNLNLNLKGQEEKVLGAQKYIALF